MDHKKRDFHDLSDEEESTENGDHVQEESRFQTIPKKKRRTDDGPNPGNISESEDDQEVDEMTTDDETTRKDPESSPAAKTGEPHVKPLTPAQLQASQRKAKKTGVIYLSRVPPFMKPATLRKLLSPYGEIGRIFLTPEPTPVYKRRVRAGGNKKKSFVDGWIEFVSKKRAKECVEMLNGNLIGGKKSGFYHDDIWNLKYLKGFKWSDLMEQVQVEERMREGKLRAELERESKERKAFMTNIGIAKHERSLGARAETEAANIHHSVQKSSSSSKARSEPVVQPSERRFKQRDVHGKNKTLPGSGSESVNRVLRSIF